MRLAGLILAAGESRRMGRPKALLEYRGETFLDRLIRLFSQHASPVIVVLGADAERIRAGIAMAGAAQIVINADWPRGQTTSMQAGLRAVPPGCDAVLFTLADHPAVGGDTVAALAADPPPLLRIPRAGGRRGHPVVFGRDLIPEFLALAENEAASDVVHRHFDRVEYIDVDDPGILADIDDPAAYRQLTGEAS